MIPVARTLAWALMAVVLWLTRGAWADEGFIATGILVWVVFVPLSIIHDVLTYAFSQAGQHMPTDRPNQPPAPPGNI